MSDDPLITGKFGVSPRKESELLAEMQRLGIREDDIDEQFLRGSGAGGQHRNKTSTRVRLKHRPSGIEVSCERERSQALNRFFARRLLCEKLDQQVTGELSKKQQEIEKLRRQKRRRSRKAKRKMLDDKRHHAKKKQARSGVGNDYDR